VNADNARTPGECPGLCVSVWEVIRVAAQTPRRRGSAEPAARKSVMASVKLDVATHTRVGVAASLAGTDKSTWMSKLITDAVQGIVIIDRRSAGSRPDPTPEDRQDTPAA